MAIETRELTYMGRRARVTTDFARPGNDATPRTVVTEWIDDATEENGGHPAGTVVTSIVRYGFSRRAEIIGETVEKPTAEPR